MEPIPEHLDPTHMAYLKAKSADYGGDTLAQHTWTVLNRLVDQYRLRSALPGLIGDERLWHRLYWGCFLHDFGKAAAGFQERLAHPKVPNAWSEGQHRHEVLSLAFVDWVFPVGHTDRISVIGIIVSHHKDADAIFAKYGSGHPTMEQRQRVEFLVNQLKPSVIDDLWLWLERYGERWRRELGLPELERITLSTRISISVDAVCRALGDFKRRLIAYEDGDLGASAALHDVCWRGLILTADHSASAGAGAFPDVQLTREVAARPLRIAGRRWHKHQERMDESESGSAILVAPTGSGKTEAALLWAARQMALRPSSRLFYTLPYQASMNAMAERLAENFFRVDFADACNNQVAIQHSRATLKYYQDMMQADSGTDPRTAAREAKARRDQVKLSYFPVQVFSPYQMLKAAYQLKGYEALLVDYAGALFIFDEIHAYDPHRLALIITMMSWLHERYSTRFLVMTATLPPLIQVKLQTALDLTDRDIITADETVFRESQRHIVHIETGDLLNSLDAIMSDFRSGQAVLVCCNQVARAQEVYRRLKDEYGLRYPEDVLLLHGRFNGKDRAEKERLLARSVGVGAALRRPMVIVATQVVEVSLDIDLDTIYTDPAPLDALLQRFGRVNRGRKERMLCPAHVFSEPLGKKESRPYDFLLVQKSLDVLQRRCRDKPIDEAQITAMLGDIYQGEIAAEWDRKYQSAERDFKFVLNSMQPYQSAAEEIYHKFYELFDGAQVLPMNCLDDYQDAIERKDYLGATQYLVNVSWGQYHALKGAGRLCGRDEHDLANHGDVPYTEEFGLDIAGALAAKDEGL